MEGPHVRGAAAASGGGVRALNVTVTPDRFDCLLHASLIGKASY